MTLTITDTVHPQVGHSVKLPCIVRQIGSKTVWIFTIIFSYFHVFSHPQNLDQIVCVSSVQALSGALGNLWCRFSLFSHCADFQSAENNCRQSRFTSDRSTNKQDSEASKHFIFLSKTLLFKTEMGIRKMPSAIGPSKTFAIPKQKFFHPGNKTYSFQM